MKKLYFLVLILVISANEAFSQKFGDVKVSDFTPTFYEIDSTANAIVLFDIGHSKFIGNSKASFSIEFQRHRRLRILDKSAFEYADIEIPLYIDSKNNDQETLVSIKAATFYLENGKLKKEEVKQKDIFEEKTSEHWITKKISMPMTSEGCIIDIIYKIESPFTFNLQSWKFQSSLPCLRSEYRAQIPEYYSYMQISRGALEYDVNESKETRDIFNLTDNSSVSHSGSFTLQAKVMDNRWRINNLPAIKPEPFVTTIDNYRKSIKFQLASVQYPNSPINMIISTWHKMYDDILQRDDFGKPIERKNNWMASEIDPLLVDKSSEMEKARAIYEHVRNKYTQTGFGGVYMRKTLRKVFDEKGGTEAEINLLLVSMLRYAGLDADPAILSRRSNGFTQDMFPIISMFDYTVAYINIDKIDYLLDATNKLSFGSLAPDCYNGKVRVVSRHKDISVDLQPNQLVEKSISTIFISIRNDSICAIISKTPGIFESLSLRKKIDKGGNDALISSIEKNLGAGCKVSELSVYNKDDYENSFAINYNISMPVDDANYITLSALLDQAQKTNPFSSMKRQYPVEFPYAIHETISSTIEIPDNYTIEELPKSTKVTINDSDGGFLYRINKDDAYIQVRSTSTISTTHFESDSYDYLRDFFGHIVKVHSTPIVLKKNN